MARVNSALFHVFHYRSGLGDASINDACDIRHHEIGPRRLYEFIRNPRLCANAFRDDLVEVLGERLRDFAALQPLLPADEYIMKIDEALG